ncbi:MAG: hypothetical protein FIB07_15025 [Candidatus Methanoperedens sp.]|nr:hypothetical protein [Candidatus Methanoperedens sp.]
MKRRIILVIILITILISHVQAAKVYGTIYEWSELDKPLNNVIVEIEENSTRVQYKVSGNGTYFFDISPGSYDITAKYYYNNILELSGEEKLRINNPDDSKNLDLILFPPIDSDYEYFGNINLTGELDTKQVDSTNYIIIFLVAFIIISIIIIIIFIWKKKRTPDVPIIDKPVPLPPEQLEEKEDRNLTELPDDLKELYDIILKKGGRITQKDLRKEVIYGEAKVSLMIADLEDRGLIKKIKKGRANIIIAENIK